MTAKVHAITCTQMFSQFIDTFANWITITKTSRFQAFYTNTNLRLGLLVTHGLKPIGQWLFAAFSLISKYFNHQNIVA